MLLIFSLLFPPSTASIIVFICLEYLLLTLVAKSNGDIFWGAVVGFFIFVHILFPNKHIEGSTDICKGWAVHNNSLPSPSYVFWYRDNSTIGFDSLVPFSAVFVPSLIIICLLN